MKRQGLQCPCLPYCLLAWSVVVLFSLRDVLLDVFRGVADGLDLLGFLVGDLHPELFLEAHDELHEVERVGVQIFHEGRFRLDIALVDPELLDYDLLEPLVGFAFGQTGYLLRVYAARPSALGSSAQVSGGRKRSSIRVSPGLKERACSRLVE